MKKCKHVKELKEEKKMISITNWISLQHPASNDEAKYYFSMQLLICFFFLKQVICFYLQSQHLCCNQPYIRVLLRGNVNKA